MRPDPGCAVTTRHQVLVFRTRHQPGQLRQDETRLFELGVEAVFVLKHDDQALHMVAVPAVNVNQLARHLVLRCSLAPAQSPHARVK